jgi:hypothetical protein
MPNLGLALFGLFELLCDFFSVGLGNIHPGTHK